MARKVESICRFKDQYAFLSNFSPAIVEFEGMTYPTSEHAFQAAKTLDPEQREAIARCDTPGKAKRLGRFVHLRPLWDEIKLDVMEAILRDKFTRNPLHLRLLVGTHPILLVEGNDWGDRYWGACYSQTYDDEPSWFVREHTLLYGQNHLGRLLMKIRNEEVANDKA